MSHPGVFSAKKKDNTIYYRTALNYNKKHISIGSYSSEDEASKAYNEAFEILNNYDITINNFGEYIEKSSISFEKAVVLINFRDNGIYSANPIYISSTILYYYLSDNEILKFDKDDLFYFISHHIQKRGGHLFVTDLGQQINLASRYGIKNHAVVGKDYIFENGDILDYRRSNITILNSYQGVSLVNQKKKIYKSQILINGNYVIGYYDSKEKAAIAYNKAADILNEKGCPINFSRNSLKITNRKYKSIYDKIEISENILNIDKSLFTE